MMQYSLKSIEIEGFRGINNAGKPLSIKFHTGVTSVYAPNGQGKSSIFQALQFALTGKISRLDQVQKSERPADYYVNLFHPDQRATIRIQLTPHDGSLDVEFTVTYNRDGSTILDSPTLSETAIRELRNDLNQDFVLLDYKEFHDFIDGNPKDRSDQLNRLLGLKRYPILRDCLGTLSNKGNIDSDFGANELDASIKRLQGQLKHVKDSIAAQATSQFSFPTPILEDTASLVSATTNMLSAHPILKPVIGSSDILSVSFLELVKAIDSDQSTANTNEFGLLSKEIAQLQSITDADTYDSEFVELSAALDARDAARAKTSGDALHRMFENVLSAMTKGEWSRTDLCPLCDSPLTSNLHDHCEAKLKDFEELKDCDLEVSRLVQALSSPERIRFMKTTLGIPQSTGTDVLAGLSNGIDKAKLSAVQQELCDLTEACRKRLEDDEKRVVALKLLVPDKEAALAQHVRSAEVIAENVKQQREFENEIAAHTRELDEINRWRDFVKKVYDAFAKAEAKLTTQRLSVVKSGFNERYEQIMVNADVQPDLQRNKPKQPQVDLLLSKFYGKTGLSASALLSESYRNAFGLALFLTAATEYSGSPRFIVLDDVMSSFDAGNQMNIVKVLRAFADPADPKSMQLIVLSHDGQARKQFNVSTADPNWHHLQLFGKCPIGNLDTKKIASSQLRIEIVNHLNAGETDLAERHLRLYLEQVLLTVIDKVKVPVPIDVALNDDKKMVGKLIDAIRTQVSLQVAAQTCILTIPQRQELDSAGLISAVANGLSHFATSDSSSFGIPALSALLALIDNVENCFKFECNCGTSRVRKFYNSLSSTGCKCNP